MVSEGLNETELCSRVQSLQPAGNGKLACQLVEL